MSMQGFRGNCDSKGKLGMCPSLAESDSGGIPRRELLLEKTVFHIRQKGVPPLLLPSSVLQLQQEKQIAKFNLLRKCGLIAHTSAAFL